MPSEWEGTVLFRSNPYSQVISDEQLRTEINDEKMGLSRQSALLSYNTRTGDNVAFVQFGDSKHIGRTNVAFDDLDCMYHSHCFDLIDDDILEECYRFNDAVLNSELYRYFEVRKGLYTAVHIRRGDIAEPTYIGAHSMISRDSYDRVLKELSLQTLSPDVVIMSDDYTQCWDVQGQHPFHSVGHRWRYPEGEFVQESIFFDFFPDFLRLMFAHTVVRANSSFSWWAACLSRGTVYSPVIHSKPVDRINKYYCQDTHFVKGNHPHFMGSKQEGFQDIILYNQH